MSLLLPGATTLEQSTQKSRGTGIVPTNPDDVNNALRMLWSIPDGIDQSIPRQFPAHVGRGLSPRGEANRPLPEAPAPPGFTRDEADAVQLRGLAVRGTGQVRLPCPTRGAGHDFRAADRRVQWMPSPSICPIHRGSKPPATAKAAPRSA